MQLEYTWASLGTTAGCSAAVLLVTQYVKDYLPRWLPTRLAVWGQAFLFLAGAWFFGEERHALSDLPLLAVNSVTIALAAMGAYETALKEKTPGKG